MASFESDEIEGLVNLYYDLDLNGSGIVSRREMREFLVSEGRSDRECDRITRAFDLNKSGQITFEEWCVVLGVDHTQTRRVDPVLPETIIIISSDIHIRHQYKIVNMAQDIIDRSREMKDAAKELKVALDRRFNKLWQVVIVKGQYWAYYSHEPKYSFVFRLGAYIVLLWRTPMP